MVVFVFQALHKYCINKILGMLKSFLFLYNPTFQNRETFPPENVYSYKQLAKTAKILSRKRKNGFQKRLFHQSKVPLSHDERASFATESSVFGYFSDNFHCTFLEIFPLLFGSQDISLAHKSLKNFGQFSSLSPDIQLSMLTRATNLSFLC